MPTTPKRPIRDWLPAPPAPIFRPAMSATDALAYVASLSPDPEDLDPNVPPASITDEDVERWRWQVYKHLTALYGGTALGRLVLRQLRVTHWATAPWEWRVTDGGELVRGPRRPGETP